MKSDGQQGLTDTPNAGVTEAVFTPASFRSLRKTLHQTSPRQQKRPKVKPTPSAAGGTFRFSYIFHHEGQSRSSHATSGE